MKIVYNVTIKVHASIALKWLHWLQHIHIPEVLQTGCFNNARILKLLETDDAEGPTYTIQYNADNLNSYNQYIEKFAGEMRDKSFKEWGDKFIAFRTVMEVVG